MRFTPVRRGRRPAVQAPHRHSTKGQGIAPDRRCYAPRLEAGLSLTLRFNRTHWVFRQAQDASTAEGLLSAPGRR
ncbi:hypothetical protein [Streptomyces sp. NPDC057253]|uniref:hypothetical protein n=1 Tax=Streptomyces sp. NPDC057253 TaxID=3346069 RepID=UPI00362AA2AF